MVTHKWLASASATHLNGMHAHLSVVHTSEDVHACLLTFSAAWLQIPYSPLMDESPQVVDPCYKAAHGGFLQMQVLFSRSINAISLF